MSEIKKYWNGLAARERLLLVLGGIIFIVFLCYNFYFKPFYEELQRNKDSIQSVRQSHADIQQKVAQARALKSSGLENANQEKLEVGSALGLIEQAATQYNIKEAINKIQPLGQTKIDVQYKDVSFDNWLRWNNDIAQKGLNSEAVSVSISEENLVSIRQTLTIE